MKGSMQQVRKRKYVNNNGVSLIELIVALLILSLVTVSLLQVFTSAARLNKANARNTAADAVAANIMEAVKAYGIEGTAKELKRVKDNSETECFGMKIGSITESSSGTPINDYLIKSNNKQDYSCLINGISEGSAELRDFSVDIHVNTKYTYTDKDNNTLDINEKPIYDFEAFKNTKSFLINPVVVTDEYYDSAAIEWFEMQNEEFVRYATPINEADEEAGRPLTYPIVNSASYDDIKEMLSRKLIVTIKDINKCEDIDPTKYDPNINYIISAEFVYKLDGSNLNNYFIQTDMEYHGIGFCLPTGVESLDSIFIFYIPFPYLSKTAFNLTYRQDVEDGREIGYETPYPLTYYFEKSDITGTVPELVFGNESIQVNSDISKEINFFVVVQGENLGINTLNVIWIRQGGENVTFISNATLPSSLPKPENGTSDGFKVKKADQTASIAEVTITVKDGTEEIRTLTSTIEEKAASID